MSVESVTQPWLSTAASWLGGTHSGPLPGHRATALSNVSQLVSQTVSHSVSQNPCWLLPGRTTTAWPTATARPTSQLISNLTATADPAVHTATASVGVSDLSLVLAFSLVLVAIVISLRGQLGLTKDILISMARAVVQLVIIGFVLKYIIRVDDLWLTGLMVAFIISVAAWNAHRRNRNSRALFWHSLVAIGSSTLVTGGVLVASGAIKFIPAQVIPICGMITSNSMIAVGLCYRGLGNGFHDQRQQVLERLALGASVSLAAAGILRTAIKTGMQPTIDSAKTVGLVSLPGMMSGLIFAGIDPVYAIKYQIMVMFMLLSATGLGATLAGYLAYRQYFNQRAQLLLD